MKKSWIALFAVFFGLLSMVQVAEAKRLGGGSSFGYSKSVPAKSYSPAPKAAPTATAPQSAATTAGKAAPASGASKWLGPLAGLAAGGLLAAMLFGDGFDGLQIMDILLFALVAFVLFKLFKSMMARKAAQLPQASPAYDYARSQENAPQPQPQAAYREMASETPVTPAYNPHAEGSIFGSALGEGLSEQAVKLNQAPAWFDADAFVDGAKQHFTTLQKAWDNADLSELQSYCTPELFALLQQEMAGMQAGDNHTVIDTLNAEIADMAIDGAYFIVSIRFSGFIEEEAGQGANSFNEIWHIRRLANDEGNWQVAGIQQMHTAV